MTNQKKKASGGVVTPTNYILYDSEELFVQSNKSWIVPPRPIATYEMAINYKQEDLHKNIYCLMSEMLDE